MDNTNLYTDTYSFTDLNTYLLSLIKSTIYIILMLLFFDIFIAFVSTIMSIVNITNIKIITYLDEHDGATSVITSIISTIGTFGFAILLIRYQDKKIYKKHKRNLKNLLIYTYIEVGNLYNSGGLSELKEKRSNKFKNLVYDKEWRNYIYTIEDYEQKTVVLEWILSIEDPLISDLENESMYDTWSEQYLNLIKKINLTLIEYFKEDISIYNDSCILNREDIREHGTFDEKTYENYF